MSGDLGRYRDLRAQWNYEKEVPRCMTCKYKIDNGHKRDGRTGKPRFQCGRFGWRVTAQALCDGWEHKRTGERLE